MTGEFGNTIRYASLETFNQEMNSRVREPEMEAGIIYPFMARLLWSRYGDAAEFQAELTKVSPLEQELGRASLELCVFITDPSDPLLVMNGESENGLIVPTSEDANTPHGQSRRISHPQAGHIGSISLGYLRTTEPIDSLKSYSRPAWLTQRASLVETDIL